MKYSEARQILEKNGMKLDTECGGETNYITCNGHTAASFSKETCYISDTSWDNDYANKYQLAIAQKVAYKLSRTKPEDREDAPKKYYLKIFNRHDGEGYLNCRNYDGGLHVYIIDTLRQSERFQTHFTDAEIKKIQQDPMFENIDLEKCKEPVEDK